MRRAQCLALTFRRDEPAPARGQIFVQRRQCLSAVSASPDALPHGVRRDNRIRAIGDENVTTLAGVKNLLGSIRKHHHRRRDGKATLAPSRAAVGEVPGLVRSG